MTNRVRVNPAAVKAVLRSPETTKALEAEAQRIASRVTSLGIQVGDEDGGPAEIPIPVKVAADDGHAYVTLAHPSGLAVQAKHGALTKSASGPGVAVTGGSS